MQFRDYRILVALSVSVLGVAVVGAVWATSGQASTDPGISVSPAQQRTFASGNMNEAYPAAAQETAECLTTAGLKNVTMSRDTAGKISFSWGGFATREEAQKAGEIYKGCYFAHMDDIDRAWQQSPEREAEATERGWEVLRCITAEHKDIVLAATEEGLRSQIASLDRAGDQTVHSCLRAAGTDIIKFTPLPR